MMNIPMHRFKYTKLSKDQVTRKLAATAAGPKSASQLSGVLAGKSLKIVTDDGPVLHYAFKSANRLTLAEGNASAAEAASMAWRSRPASASHCSGVGSSTSMSGRERTAAITVSAASRLATSPPA